MSVSRRKGVFGLLLVVPVVLALVSTASAAARHLKVHPCNIYGEPVETSRPEVTLPPATVNGISYTVTVQTSRVTDEARFYPRRHRCRFTGPHMLIRDVTVYRTTTQVPQAPAEANTVIEEVITTSKTVWVGKSRTTSGEVRTARQEIAPAVKVVQVPSPTVSTGTGTSGVCYEIVPYVVVDKGPGLTPPTPPTTEGAPVAKVAGGAGTGQTQVCNQGGQG